MSADDLIALVKQYGHYRDKAAYADAEDKTRAYEEASKKSDMAFQEITVAVRKQWEPTPTP